MSKGCGHLKLLQRRIYRNKVAKGFNVSRSRNGVREEIVHLVEELGELAAAHRRGNRSKVINALIDLMVFDLGFLEILGVNTDREMDKVLVQNEKRRYRRRKDGSWMRVR
ncbi:MAG: hypothetical protein HYW90_02850 [Candidatus Sungbacteria bacterium]|nr:hypothetical protein [Candidatus Sungbacteria bacterium]